MDQQGVEVAHARTPTPWQRVDTGADLDPDELFTSTLAAATRAISRAGPGKIAAIGVAGIAETGVLLDAHDRPAVPSIAWYDTRGAEQAERLGKQILDFSERTGLPATPLCTIAKYAWMRERWPDARRAVRWSNIAEWIVYRLGGRLTSEGSLASRTGFYDLHTQAPWQTALDWANAPAGLVRPPEPGGTPLGRAAGPDRLRGAVLVVAGHDHVAAAVGAGAIHDGDVLDSCGTAEALQRPVEPLPPSLVGRAVSEGFTVGWHTIAGRDVLQSAIWSGHALQAVLTLLGVPVEERHALETDAVHAEPGRLAVHGLGNATLTIEGLDLAASPAALYRATLEAIGRQGATVLARMESLAGPARRLVVTGGWAEGVAARAVKEKHLGAFIHSAAIFTGCRGAALLAGEAARLWPRCDRDTRGPAPGGNA